MSIIHINQITNKITELFDEYIDKSDLKESDPQRQDKIITRCLAAYAIYSSIECTPQEAAQSVVDGGDDNGIDALYYSPMHRKMFIVQSKWSKNGQGEPDSQGVAKFCNGVRDLFNMDFIRFNKKLELKIPIIDKALKEYGTKYDLIFIDTCIAKDLAIHSTRHIDDLLLEMNSTSDNTSDNSVNFIRLNQNKVHSSLAFRAGNTPIDIELGLTQWGIVTEPYKAFYGMVSGKEIAEWWREHNNKLFDKNIRQVLGKTDVNEEIEKTLKNNAELFWYFNNGITIIADKIEKSIVGGGNRDLGTFKLTNVAIVNGAQTVSTIGKFALDNQENNRLEDVKVNIRMIQLSETPEDFDKEVTKTNNRQNRIEGRDFVSQDPEQIRIKTELAIDEIDYNIMRSENFKKYSEKSFELTEATAALACASGKTSLAVQAKGGIGKFYENLDKGIYKELFNASVPGVYVYNSVKVVRLIESVLENEIQHLEKNSGKKYGILVHGNRLIALLTISHLNLANEFYKIDFQPNEAIIKAKVLEIIDKVSEFLEQNYPDSILGTLFKNATKCSHITSNV